LARETQEKSMISPAHKTIGRLPNGIVQRTTTRMTGISLSSTSNFVRGENKKTKEKSVSYSVQVVGGKQVNGAVYTLPSGGEARATGIKTKLEMLQSGEKSPLFFFVLFVESAVHGDLRARGTTEA
jgi:hypothetical protein